MQASPPDLVILDCDGVLVDSEAISARVLAAMLAPFGVAADFAYIRARFFGRSFPTVAATIRREAGVDLPPSFERDYRAALLARFETELRPMPGVAQALARLTVPFCLASSSSPERVRRSLALTGLLPRFEGAIFTASEVARGKPAPDLFLHAARRCGIAPARCLVVEDSEPGVEAGLAAGMRVLRYVGGAHLSDLAPADLRAFAGVAVFDSWDDFTHTGGIGTRRTDDGHGGQG